MTEIFLLTEANWAEQRHILTDKIGIPLSVVKSSANIHNIKRVAEWLIIQLSKDHQHIKLKKQKKKKSSTSMS